MAESGALPPEAVRKGVSKSLFAGTVVLVAIIAFVGGLGLSSVLLAPAPAKEFVVVGTNTPFPPMEARDPATGELVGLDIDIMNDIGRRNGWQIIWKDFQDWDALLAAIEFQGVDIGASSITSSGTVGAARNASFDFSDWYYEADQAVLIRAGTTAVSCAAAECTVAELANHPVAVQTLTTSYWWILDNLVDPGLTPEAMFSDFGDVNTVIQELLNGAVDWVFLDKPAAQNFANANVNLEVAGTIETNELYAFAVADGDPGNLIAETNSALAAMKADGTLQTLFDKWFGA